MAEQYPFIGKAMKLEVAGSEQSSGGLAFEFQHGERPYNILLSNEEMDKVLGSGLEKMLGNRAMSGFDYRILLETPDLPLFVGAASIKVAPNTHSFHEPVMETSIVTMSHVHEQRGILEARRENNGEWEFLRYEVQPPLRDLEAVLGIE